MAVYDLITAVSGKSIPGAAAFDRVVNVYGTANNPQMKVSLGADQMGIEPGAVVTLSAVVTGGPGASLSIVQTLGPSVVLLGGPAGPTWTYIAPSTVDSVYGVQLSFTVTATLSGVSTTDEAIHFIYPNTVAQFSPAGQLVAVPVLFGGRSVPTFDSGLTYDSGTLYRR